MAQKTAKYLIVKESIKEQIKSAKLKIDDKLPTEAEYASIYNVSNITIRRALTELAEEGYIKRLKHKGTFVTSQSKTTSSSKLIALILYSEDHNDTSYIQIIKGVQTMASSFDYSLIVEWSNGGAKEEAEAINKMLSLNVKGFILYSFDPASNIQNYQFLKDKGLPFVLLDRYDLNHPCFLSGCNNYDGGSIATQYLLQNGHTKIKFAGFNFFLKSEQERYEGFCSMMKKHGHPISDSNLLLNINYDNLAQQIQQKEISAIFCCNDMLAINLIRQLRERDIRIPEDLSVIGFDDWTQSPDVIRELTTIRQDFAEIGSNASFLLLSIIQGKLSGNPVKMQSSVSLIIRNTVKAI